MTLLSTWAAGGWGRALAVHLTLAYMYNHNQSGSRVMVRRYKIRHVQDAKFRDKSSHRAWKEVPCWVGYVLRAQRAGPCGIGGRIE